MNEVDIEKKLNDMGMGALMSRLSGEQRGEMLKTMRSARANPLQTLRALRAKLDEIIEKLENLEKADKIEENPEWNFRSD
jgi:hypothetical protein